MRIRYDENLDQTIIAMRDSRDRQEKDVVWLKGNILALGKTRENKNGIVKFTIPYDSQNGFSIAMDNSKFSLKDDKKAYVLSDEFKDAKGRIIVEIDELKHENLRACRLYDHEMNEYKYSKYIFEKYGVGNSSRIEGIRHENGATYDIHFNGQQFKLNFDEKGLFLKGIQILPNGEEKELTNKEASSIHLQANRGQLMEEYRVRVLRSIAFKNDLPNIGKTKFIATDDWSYPLPLTSEIVAEQRRLEKDYRKILCSTAVVLPMVLAGLMGIQKCQSIQDKEPTKAKQIQKGQNATVNRQIQKQKNEKSY